MNRRTRKNIVIAIAILCLIAAATAVEMFIMDSGTAPFGTMVMFFALLNFNVIALLALIIFVGRNLIKLFVEYRKGILGHKFKTKVVSLFLFLIAIPLTLMFLVASELGKDYIDRFFTPKFRDPIESSMSVAGAYYESQKAQALDFALMAAKGYSLPVQIKTRLLANIPDGETSRAILGAFEGRHEAEVVTGPDGQETIRAAVPADWPEGGVVLVEAPVPRTITDEISKIEHTYEDYLNLESMQRPVKLNYLMMLGFFTLVIIFTALWISIKVADWMAEPVKELALATREVADGNLSVNVQTLRKDEIGLLINSFNTMVTELRLGKESLQRAYVNLDNIIRSIQSGVVSLDPRGNIISLNASACRIFSVSPEDVIGHNYKKLMRNIKSEGLSGMVHDINLKTLKETQREVWVNTQNGKLLLRVSIMALKGEGSAILEGILVVLDDVTEVTNAQRAMAWQEVARRMAHEIKNPLTPIRLSTERMRKKWEQKAEDFDSIFERSTQSIIREVETLRNMVDEFSKLGRMPEIKRSPLYIGDSARDVINLYRDISGVKITLEERDGIPQLMLDAEQIRRVLINLFDNAIEAMGREGSIVVTIVANEARDHVYLSVADNGPGISDANKEHIFQPHFSLREGGSGLGLAIADRIIEEHGGFIRVSDNQPRGAVFTISMPVPAQQGAEQGG